MTKFVQTPEGTSLLDTSVNMWAMRAFDVQATEDLGGTVDSTLTEQGGSSAGRISGTVANHLPHALTGCVLLHGNQWQTLGDLRPGASIPISSLTAGGSGPAGSLSGLPMGGHGSGSDSEGNIRARIQAALADYVRSLGQQNNGTYYSGGPVQAPAVYTPSPGEALLLGWSDDPALAGPNPRVDGHAVTENAVSLVIIHLPIRGAKIVTAVPQPPQFTSRPTTFSPLLPFSIVSRNSALYRQAKSTGSPNLAALPRTTVHVRGIVRVVTQDPSGPLLILGPAAGQPANGRSLAVALRGPQFNRIPSPFTLQGRELLVSGPVSSRQGLPQIVLTQPSQMQVVQ